MSILVAGDAGYTCSHTCITLLETRHKVIASDNTSNSRIETVNMVREITEKDLNFYHIDVTDET